MPSNTHEQQFLNALRDIFIGAPVEGDSGYINLMKIKSRYYTQGVFPRLQADIDKACKPFEPAFREELFDKLHDFFKAYFSESGSIYFRRTPGHQNVYDKVYTDDRDVILFWKTHMLYYVKTDRLFTSLEVALDDVIFFFDVSSMELKRSNEKRELVYAFHSIRQGKLNLAVGYSERGRKTKTDDILKAAREGGLTVSEDALERACRIFEKQSEVDYFINKDASAFLREQFDLWLYQYVFSGQNTFTETRLKQLQAIKDIAFKIIDFIAQFEDELARVWNKPRFVLNSHYVLTLDKITDPALLEKIFVHPNFPAQLQEWHDLGMLDDQFKLEMLTEKDLTGALLHPRFHFLPLDTKYFPDLELEILALFEDLDAALDGWLIHSENYQALNSLLLKFQEQVQCIYIDPPYNSGDDGFAYSNLIKHASWLTMMEDRISLGKDFLPSNGTILVSIDDKEIHRLRILLDNCFHEENFVDNIIWKKRYGGGAKERHLVSLHEYILFYTKNLSELENIFVPTEQESIDRYYKLKDNNYAIRGPYRTHPLEATKSMGDRRNLIFPIKAPDGSDVFPRRQWLWSRERVQQALSDNELEFLQNRDGWTVHSKQYLKDKNGVQRESKAFSIIDDVFTQHGTNEIIALFGNAKIFAFPKPSALIMTLIQFGSSTSDESIVLDFFAGSGTTAHAVMNLNRDGGRRKYILVEMGEHFNTVILPRVKKVAFSDQWKAGKAQPGKGLSHFVKYFDLEQYEDTLRRARYEDSELLKGADPYTSYVFLRDLKLLDALSIDFTDDRLDLDLASLYPAIDLAETLSCVTGKWIKRITPEMVEFADGSTASLTHPDWSLIKPLVWW